MQGSRNLPKGFKQGRGILLTMIQKDHWVTVMEKAVVFKLFQAGYMSSGLVKIFPEILIQRDYSSAPLSVGNMF